VALRLFACACRRQVWHLLSTEAAARSLSERWQRESTGHRTCGQRPCICPISRSQRHDGARRRQRGHRPRLWLDENDLKNPRFHRATQPVTPRVPLRARTCGPARTIFWTGRVHGRLDSRLQSRPGPLQAHSPRDIFPPPEYVPRLDPAWLPRQSLPWPDRCMNRRLFHRAHSRRCATGCSCDDEMVLHACRTTRLRFTFGQLGGGFGARRGG